uniref:Uncharacterized protein n=1 Tax=Rhizophora mucronata TaxID=61149 RepID=A0A2P2NAJ4_RHIMU
MFKSLAKEIKISRFSSLSRRRNPENQSKFLVLINKQERERKKENRKNTEINAKVS